MAGTLFVVATPIGNLEDITARALRVLREVSLIAAEDTRRTSHLLTHYGIRTPTTSLHEHNEHRKAAALLSRLKRGEDIALVSDAGTPTVSDPGQHLILEAIRSDVRVEPIPGPSAITAALAVSGFPADTFQFMGFPPSRSKDRQLWLKKLSSLQGTVVFFEAPHRILGTLEDLRAELGNIEVALTRELTKLHYKLVRRPISDIISGLSVVKGEMTVVLYLVDRTNISANTAPSPDQIWDEFCYLTRTNGVKRREAVSILAKKYSMPSREVYMAIETAKNSVN
jgi:16S rRNA (cytidine1402-2'-O)-methyltransferase